VAKSGFALTCSSAVWIPVGTISITPAGSSGTFNFTASGEGGNSTGSTSAFAVQFNVMVNGATSVGCGAPVIYSPFDTKRYWNAALVTQASFTPGATNTIDVQWRVSDANSFVTVNRGTTATGNSQHMVMQLTYV